MSDERPEHVLVIGGTGMLRGATLALAKGAKAVTVVGRSVSRLKRLAEEAENVTGVAVDYHDDTQLQQAVDAAVRRSGPIDLVVAWIHETAPRAAELIAARLAAGGRRVAFYHVLGSAHADPSGPAFDHRAAFARHPHVEYHEVILGFVVRTWGARWLTDHEISGGVVAAIDARADRHIVGTVRPWDKRP